MSPKQCECGIQGKIIDTRQYEDHVTRRYGCPACGVRWSTVELRLEIRAKNLQAALIKRYSTVQRDDVADKLIALAQEVMRS